MKKSILIKIGSVGDVTLNSIKRVDQELLRIWKNKHRKNFFFQKIIDSKMQKKWFRNYLLDPKNYMFIVKTNGYRIGCMGFKVTDKEAEIYNVILGDKRFQGQGCMSQAFAGMCQYIRKIGIRGVVLKVLKTNKNAQKWYRKNGFEKEFSEKDCHVMRLKKLLPKNV